MEKGMCLGALGISGLFLILFVLDLVIGMPFGWGTPDGGSNPFFLADVFGAMASGILGYLSVNALRDIK